MEDITKLFSILMSITYTYRNAEHFKSCTATSSLAKSDDPRCFSIQLWLAKMVSAMTFCKESAMTVRYVERCPVDLQSWETAAKNMNCESIQQNCSQSLSKGNHVFQFHCVINHWMNATLEVCGLNRTIFDYCAEYNTMGRVIQENYNADCSKHNPPCSPIYNSAEAYKYQTCYALVRKNRQKTEEKDKDSQNPDLRSTSERVCGNLAFTLLSMFQLIHVHVLR